MERTTNPSVEVPSDAIAAAITATSSGHCQLPALELRQPEPVSVQKLPLLLLFLCFCFLCSGTRNELEQRDQKISIIRITNTVPSPISVFSAAFFIVVAKEYFTSTESDVGVQIFVEYINEFSFSFSKATGTVAVYSSLEYSISTDPVSFISPSSFFCTIPCCHGIFCKCITGLHVCFNLIICQRNNRLVSPVSSCFWCGLLVGSSISPSARTSDAPENVNRCSTVQLLSRRRKLF